MQVSEIQERLDHEIVKERKRIVVIDFVQGLRNLRFNSTKSINLHWVYNIDTETWSNDTYSFVTRMTNYESTK